MKFLTLLWLSFLCLAGFFIPVSAVQMNAAQMLKNPAWPHLLGMDSLGRDLFLRILLAAQNSLLIGFTATFISLLIAFLVGVIFSEVFPRLTLQILNLLQAFPGQFFAFLIAFFLIETGLVSGLLGVIFALGLTHWIYAARVYLSFKTDLMKNQFIEASYAMGSSRWETLFTHFAPRMFKKTYEMFLITLPQIILAESLLSFVGFGVQPPQTSWGQLLREGWSFFALAPGILLFPAGFLFITIFLIDWVRSARVQVGRSY